MPAASGSGGKIPANASRNPLPWSVKSAVSRSPRMMLTWFADSRRMTTLS